MRNIFFFSDTHGFHEQIEVPACDIAIFCGDESNHSNQYMNVPESIKFLEWYSKTPAKHKLMIAGNHSTAIYHKLVDPKTFGITYLEHELLEIEGLRIFGSPYTPAFGKSWAFMKQRGKLDEVWQTIPEGIDVLVTHGPPKGILDLTDDPDNGRLVQVGCTALYNHVTRRIKPKIHAFGHIHSEKNYYNRGIFYSGETTFVNAACYNHKQKIIYQGFTLPCY